MIGDEIMKTSIKRALGLAAAATLAVTMMWPALAADKTLRVGYQKYGTFLLLKARGLLEKKLEPLGYAVTWTEFPGGPQLLEALNVGALDFGITGEAPPIFAQAAGAPLVYVANEPPAPLSEAILVPKDSPIKTRRRPQGQEGRAEQGLQRPLPAGQGAGEGGPRLHRRHTGLPQAVRRPRRLRARRRRRLGDLGSVPGRGRGRDRGAHAGRRRRASSPTTSSISASAASPTPIRRCDRRHHRARIGEIDAWAGGNVDEAAEELAPAVGIPAPILKLALEPPGLGRQADHAGGRRRAAEDRRHLPRAWPDPEGDQGLRRHARQRAILSEPMAERG